MNLLKRREENFRQSTKQERFGKPWLKYSAHFSTYDNLLDMYILLLKGKRQPLPDVLFFQMFFQKDVLKNFGMFTGKTPVQESPFNKVVDLDTYNFIKNRLQHWCFPVTFAHFLTSLFLIEHHRWLLWNGVKSLQIILLFSLINFLKSFFSNRFLIHKNYVQNIHCLALMPHSHSHFNLIVNLTHVVYLRLT